MKKRMIDCSLAELQDFCSRQYCCNECELYDKKDRCLLSMCLSIYDSFIDSYVLKYPNHWLTIKEMALCEWERFCKEIDVMETGKVDIVE